MSDVRFYTTADCRLCDEALDMAMPIITRLRYDLQVIDIIDDPEAERLYSERIPVIYRLDQNTALQWPFSAAALYRFLA